MSEQIEYKGHTINIIHDESPMNPFTDWDFEPSLMYNNGSRIVDYSDGGIMDNLMAKATTNKVIKHQRKILDICGYRYSKENFDLDYPTSEYSKEERADILKDEFMNQQDVEIIAKLHELFNIPHYYSVSKGYSQRDWADVLVVITDKDRERIGIYKKHDEKVLSSAFKLFGYWAWGDVFGYNIEGDFCNDSCTGFYGDDLDESGLLVEAKDAIDYSIELNEQKKVQKLKGLIKKQCSFICAK